MKKNYSISGNALWPWPVAIPDRPQEPVSIVCFSTQ